MARVHVNFMRNTVQSYKPIVWFTDVEGIAWLHLHGFRTNKLTANRVLLYRRAGLSNMTPWRGYPARIAGSLPGESVGSFDPHSIGIFVDVNIDKIHTFACVRMSRVCSTYVHKDSF